ncbi:hypothetical protein NP233_g7346 [Leucocoprinus birnbaumii]|uniref:ARM repeat-containing protein n=1 Tax=Leucocoprinus birnbaumii TaxID=56174 RepID=A0AAD5YUU6_9AGAR|nr:hypothetical protein NP233_g7346 [Leucocoprinus birnbaumii]
MVTRLSVLRGDDEPGRRDAIDDLEHDSISRICLALDNIIHTSFADVIPAVQERLYELLSHNHPSVRRRALYAVRSLSKHESGLLEHVHTKVLRRINDSDTTVAGAASRVAETIFSTIPKSSAAIQDAVNDAFESRVHIYSPTERGLMVTSLEALRGIGLRTLSLPAAFSLLTACSSSHDAVITIGLYRVLKAFDHADLRAVEEQTKVTLIGAVRDYLRSRNPNDTYLFLSCLESIDPGLWAGTSEAIPAVLEAWEVELIMQLLDSNDDLIRKKTLHLLNLVDEDILNAYYSRAVSVTTSIALPLKDLNMRVKRLLEILDVTVGVDGELYAGQIKNLLGQIEPHATGNGILDSAIEGILLHVRSADSSFQVACAATMLAILCDQDAQIGPTMTVILAALATEYSRLVSFPPVELLSGICHWLTRNPPIVQEPCLLAMLRIAADCEEVPKEVMQNVSEAGQNASRHIRRRCDQFTTLSGQKEVLLGIITNSRSLTLPDFLAALEIHSRNISHGAQNGPEANFPQISPASSKVTSPGGSTSKLRYEAYATPQAIPSLRTNRLSDSQRSHPGSSSQQGPSNARSLTSDSLSHTPASLGLAHATLLGEMSAHTTEEANPKQRKKLDVEDLSSRVDLIAFDSPFVVDADRTGTESSGNNINQGELDFESIWNSDQSLQYNARGWCDAAMDDVIRRLQGMSGHRLQVGPVDVSPFIGDLKITIISKNVNGYEGIGLLRLKDSDEDTSLWRLRCTTVELRDEVQQLLGNQ